LGQDNEAELVSVGDAIHVDARVFEVERSQGPAPSERRGQQEPILKPLRCEGAWPPLKLQLARLAPAFPLRALSQWHSDFVEQLAESKQVAVDGPAMLSLAMIGGAAAKRARVHVWGEEYHPLNLWVLLVMPTGEGKSPVLSALVHPLERFQQEAIEEIRRRAEATKVEREIARRRYQNRVRCAAQADDETRRSALKAEAEQLDADLKVLEPPPEPRLYTEDTTPEALVQLLAANHGALTLVSDEGSTLFSNAIRRASDGVDAIEALLKAHSGTNLIVDRVSRPALHVAAPELSIAIATQGRVFARLLRREGFAGRGLWERFLVVLPPSRVGARVGIAPDVDRWVNGHYAATIGSLLSLPIPVGGKRAHTIQLERGARELMKQFIEEVDRRMSAGGDLGDEALAGWSNKIRTNLFRIAGILRVAEDTPAEGLALVIGLRIAQGAVDIMRYCLEHAAGVLRPRTPLETDVLVVLEWVREVSRPSFRVRDLHRARQTHFPRVAELEVALDELVACGAIRRLERADHGLGRRPTEYEVHPELRVTE
jgi:replicative DNA helicase